ncbi:hypothetical protein JSO56_06600 [Riemerella anatipestifer]|uniref:DUF6263 family protein n=1 Tax=Riemerella anatipestifer TaxID=34085 RepID=UPI0030BCCA49
MIKKIIALSIVAFALTSCKKDKETKVVINKETGKAETITVDTPQEEEAKIPEAKPAIADSAGVYSLSFKLEKGKTYPLTSFQRDITTVKDPSGKSISGTQEMTDEITFTVNDFVNGTYDITVNLVGKVNKSSSQGKTVVVDTKQAAPKEEQLKGMWTVNKALSGNKLQMKIDEKGNVISISGFDAVYKKVEQNITSLIKDAKERKQFMDSFKQGFNEKMFKEQFTQSLNILPKKGVKIGETWTETDNLTPDGKLKISTTYKLEKVADGKAEVSIKGGIPKKSDSKKQEGITHSISVEGSQNGKIILDANTGWILSSKQNMTTTQKESLSDGKQSQTMTQTTQSSITLNP